MRQKIRRVLTVVILVLGCGTAAQAANTFLVTPVVFIGTSQSLDCVVTNFDTTPAVISVGLFNAFGQSIIPDINDCNSSSLASGHTCSVITSGAALCRVVSSTKKVHVAVEVFDPPPAGLVVMFPATRP